MVNIITGKFFFLYEAEIMNSKYTVHTSNVERFSSGLDILKLGFFFKQDHYIIIGEYISYFRLREGSVEW